MRAVANGARPRVQRDLVILNHTEWAASGNCTKPHRVVLQSRPQGMKMVIDRSNSSQAAAITMDVRCRQCENCLKAKAAHWRLRALAEWRAAPRTWLVTLTFSPQAQFAALTRARRHIDAQGLDFDSLSIEDQFELRHRETGREVTLWLKRLRKAGSVFRYMMVAEAHQTGLPHYHLLIHEQDVTRPVRKSGLQGAWTSGFSHAKLVTTPAGATYATKYLVKSHMARVRASVAYGSCDTALTA